MRLAWLTEYGLRTTAINARYRLWHSDIDGGDIVCVGEMEGQTEQTETGPTGERFHWPQDIQWLPGGQRISFTFRGGIWVVPA